MANQAIALGVRPVQTPNMLAQAADVLAVSDLVQQQQGRRGVQQAIAGGMAPTDPRLLQYGAQGREAYSAAITGEKSQLENADRRIKMIGGAAGYLRNNPSPDAFGRSIQTLLSNGVISPEEAQAAAAEVGNDPARIKAYADRVFTQAIDAEAQLMRTYSQDVGGAQQVVGVDPVSGQVKTLSRTAKTLTPGQLAEQRQAEANRAMVAQQQAQINAVMGRGAPTAAPPAAPTAQAFPVAPPVDTGVYEPGTPGAINQMYAQSRAGQTPALNALAVEPTTTADPRLSQLAELDRLAMQGNAQAADAAKTLRSQLEFEQKMVTGQDPTKRYLNVGDGVVFDTRTQTYLPNPERRAKVGTPLPVVTPEGNVVYVAPEEAIGKTPGSQAPTAAERAKQAKAEKGRNAVDDVLVKIQGYYTELNKLGGVPSTERGVISNIGAYTAGAIPAAGRAVGSKEQKIRDQITQIRSALVREIKNATGMSAQELNSNVELQLALEAATDPTISYEANLETLRNLSNLYGSGKLAQQPQGAADTETDPDIAEALKIIRGEQ